MRSLFFHDIFIDIVLLKKAKKMIEAKQYNILAVAVNSRMNNIVEMNRDAF